MKLAIRAELWELRYSMLFDYNSIYYCDELPGKLPERN